MGVFWTSAVDTPGAGLVYSRCLQSIRQERDGCILDISSRYARSGMSVFWASPVDTPGAGCVCSGHLQSIRQERDGCILDISRRCAKSRFR
eukprot:gene11113-biopygen6569